MILRYVIGLFLLVPLGSSAQAWHEGIGREIKVGIICGSSEGADALQKQMSCLFGKTQVGLREYHSGILWDFCTVITMGRNGKVAAASTATHLIESEQVDLIISLGTAGTTDGDLSIGDVVVGEHCVQWDLDGRPFSRVFQVPLLGRSHFPSDPELLKLLTVSLEEINWAASPFESATWKSGLIVTGDHFIRNPKRFDDILESFPDAYCVDMECGAIGQVCFEYECPFIPIRVIADRCDHAAVADLLPVERNQVPSYWITILREFFWQLGDFLDQAANMELCDSDHGEQSSDEEDENELST